MINRADKLLIIILALLSLGNIIYEWQRADNDRPELEIIANGQRQHYMLNGNRIIEVDGTLGTVQIQVKNGQARVLSAYCPDKICEKTGWIASVPQRAVCVPNKVIVSIVANQSDIDVIIQ